MSPPSDLRHLAVGDRMEGPLLVLDVDHRDSVRGPFTTLTLGNSLGQLPTAPVLGGGSGAHRGRPLLGHITLGILMLDRRVGAEEPAPCTVWELTILHHLIASHHGKLEFGAAVSPMTLEAEVLHFATTRARRPRAWLPRSATRTISSARRS